MKKKKGKRKNKLGRIVTGILAAVLVFILSIGLAVTVLYKSGEVGLKAAAASNTPVMEVSYEEISHVMQRAKMQSVLTWEDDWVVWQDKVYSYKEETLNFLLLGIDQKGSLSRETELEDWSAGQADTIFLVSLDQKKKEVSVIAVPRNSMVSVAIYNEERECIDTIYNQICLQYGYAGGGELGIAKMKDCVSELLYQLPIHGVCAISFDAIGILTDMVGGVEVTVPDDMTKWRPEYQQGAVVNLTGKNVLEYLRYRNYQALGSPTIRLTRQKEFMQAAIMKGITQLKKDPMLVSDMYQAIIPYMNTDITLDKAVYLAAQAIDYRISADSFYQLKGEDKKVEFTTKTGAEDFYDDYYLDEEGLKQTVMEIFYEEVIIDDKVQQ